MYNFPIRLCVRFELLHPVYLLLIFLLFYRLLMIGWVSYRQKGQTNSNIPIKQFISYFYRNTFQFYKWLMDRQYNSTSEFKFKVLHKGIPLKLVSQKAPRVWNFIDQQDTDHFQHTNDSFIKIKKISCACGYCKTFWSESGNITKKSLVLSCIFVSSKVHLIS